MTLSLLYSPDPSEWIWTCIRTAPLHGWSRQNQPDFSTDGDALKNEYMYMCVYTPGIVYSCNAYCRESESHLSFLDCESTESARVLALQLSVRLIHLMAPAPAQEALHLPLAAYLASAAATVARLAHSTNSLESTDTQRPLFSLLYSSPHLPVLPPALARSQRCSQPTRTH